MVVALIAASKPFKMVGGHPPTVLLHGNRLETAFQGGILFNILAVLLDGGAYKLKPPSWPGWALKILEASSAPSRASRANDRVDLIDEQKDFSSSSITSAINLLDSLLFELTAVFLDPATIPDKSSVRTRFSAMVSGTFPRLSSGRDLPPPPSYRLGLTDQTRVVLRPSVRSESDAISVRFITGSSFPSWQVCQITAVLTSVGVLPFVRVPFNSSSCCRVPHPWPPERQYRASGC